MAAIDDELAPKSQGVSNAPPNVTCNDVMAFSGSTHDVPQTSAHDCHEHEGRGLVWLQHQASDNGIRHAPERSHTPCHSGQRARLKIVACFNPSSHPDTLASVVIVA